MTESVTRRVMLLTKDAKERTFGTSDERKAAFIRHGYLLALEEVQRALSDEASPRHDTT